VKNSGRAGLGDTVQDRYQSIIQSHKTVMLTNNQLWVN